MSINAVIIFCTKVKTVPFTVGWSSSAPTLGSEDRPHSGHSAALLVLLCPLVRHCTSSGFRGGAKGLGFWPPCFSLAADGGLWWREQNGDKKKEGQRSKDSSRLWKVQTKNKGTFTSYTGSTAGAGVGGGRPLSCVIFSIVEEKKMKTEKTHVCLWMCQTSGSWAGSGPSGHLRRPVRA